MKVVNLFDKIDEKIVLALGFFDCVHIGHQKLIKEAQHMALKHNASCCVFTFKNNMGLVLKKKLSVVTTYKERLVLLERLGVDYVLSAKFDETFMNFSPEDFWAIISKQNLAGIVCGFDYKFGKNSQGDTVVLEDFCKKHSMDFKKVEQVQCMGKKASTSLVKDLLHGGEIEGAKQCLGYDFFISGTVEHGFGIGKEISFPTANIKFDQEKISPKLGVYAGEILVQGQRFKCVINAGNRPTFDDMQNKLEVHILDFSGDLYGKEVVVCFKKFLREITKFENSQLLKEQIEKDVTQCKVVSK